MLESSFLGLSGSALHDPLNFAGAILSGKEIGLEVFALGEVDPAFRAPLDEFRNACAKQDHVGIARSRLRLSHPLLFMTSDDWAVKFSQLEKMGWPLRGGIFATQPRDTKAVSVGDAKIVDLIQQLLLRAQRFYALGVAFKTQLYLREAEEQFKESARIYAGLVAIYNEANLLEDVQSVMKGHARSLEAAGNCISKLLRHSNKHFEHMLAAEEEVFERWSRNLLEMLTLFERALRTYEMAEAAPSTLKRVRRKLAKAESYYQRLQKRLESVSSSHTHRTG